MRYLTLILLFIAQVGFSQSALHTSLAGYWNFDEASGNLIDQVSTNDGTITGATQNVSGKINTAYSFASGNYITLPDNATMSFYNTNLTIACWVYITAYPTSGNEYAIVGGEDYSAGMAINSNGYLIYTEAAYDSASVASTTKIPLSAWTHVGVTFNYTTNVIAYYINGAAAGTATMSGDVVNGSSSNKIGDNWWVNDYFAGSIDELGYWKTILSAALFDTLVNGVNGTGTEGYAYPFHAGTSTAPGPFQIFPFDKKYQAGAGLVFHDTKYGAGAALDLQDKHYQYPSTYDTVHYYLYDDFESWTTASVSSYDSLMKRLPINGFFMPAQQSIIPMSGHGNVWDSYIPTSGETSLQLMINLGDTTSEAIFEFDFMVEDAFSNAGQGGTSSHKFPGGFYSGDDIYPSVSDSVNRISGRGGWAGLVSGNSNDYLMAYPFYQPEDGDWDGHADGAYGAFQLPYGTWIRLAFRQAINEVPGGFSGFNEVYRDGVLVIRQPTFKTRSVSQGEHYGKIELARLMYFFGAYPRSSTRNNHIYIDNIVVYKYKPGSVMYGYGINEFSGGITLPTVMPPASSKRPAEFITDETYTNVSDTIYDVGNGKHYLYWPYYKNEVVTKEVVLVSGTINFTFLSEQFGDGWPGDCPYVRVYTGTGVGKTLYGTYGRDGTPCLLTNPSGTYNIPDNEATFEIYTGSNYGLEMGVAIRYWQP